MRALPLVLGLLLALAAPAPGGQREMADFGGEDGLSRMTEDFVNRLVTNPRIKRHFVKADTERLTFMLYHQFCEILGGSCIYKGKSMKDAHAHMAIDTDAFNALVEDLQAAMRAARVPFRSQVKLVARLAPMNRAIVRH